LSCTVFYLNPRATEDVCRIIRERMPPGWRLLKAEGDDFSAGLAEADFILVADHPVTAAHLAQAPRLRMIQHQGVGYERIDLDACRLRRIPVGLTPEGTSVGVAEHTILLILAVYKRLLTAANGTRAGEWMQWELRNGSFELCGKTLGIVGLGRIGREVARRALAFDVRVLYYDPLVAQPDDFAVTRAENLESFLGEADIVTLHVPLTPESRHWINRRTLELMKPGAVLINTARGGLVDEAALVEALRSGRLTGAGLDVMEEEPPDPANPLLRMENVLVTPHIAAGTRDALIAKMRAAFANMVRHTQGEPLRNVVPELADLAGSAADAAEDREGGR
jgi:phosphoglycerate dehydrogenase-like enzyme